MPALLYSVPLTLQQAAASAGDSWMLTGKSVSVSCGVTAPFSWVLVHTRFCLCSPETVSPVLWRFCNQIPLASKVIFPGGSQSLCQVGKYVVGPRTFITMRELLWCNCSVVCGLSALWPYGGTKGDFPQEEASQICCSQSPCPRAGHC